MDGTDGSPGGGLASTAAGDDDGNERWLLRLYVAGSTPRSQAAERNLETLCERHLAGRYRIEVIDLGEDPELAGRDGVLALPTLVRLAPGPRRKVVGDLSLENQVLRGLGIARSADS